MGEVIICGPPPKCTCPAVAWYCICAASRRTSAAEEADQ